MGGWPLRVLYAYCERERMTPERIPWLQARLVNEMQHELHYYFVCMVTSLLVSVLCRLYGFV